jgi:hypothetical protein
MQQNQAASCTLWTRGRLRSKTMKLTGFLLLGASAVLLVACGGWLLVWFGGVVPPKAAVSAGRKSTLLQFVSDPPGASATTSVGGSCRTPCALQVTAASSFTVTFAREGADPVTLPVEVGDGPKFTPNPVFAYLAPRIEPGASLPEPAPAGATVPGAGPPTGTAAIPVRQGRSRAPVKRDAELDRRERELDKLIRGICRGC